MSGYLSSTREDDKKQTADSEPPTIFFIAFFIGFFFSSDLKTRLHIPSTHAFSELRCVFPIFTLIEQTNVSSWKTQRNAERMWQLDFRVNQPLLFCDIERVFK